MVSADPIREQRFQSQDSLVDLDRIVNGDVSQIDESQLPNHCQFCYRSINENEREFFIQSTECFHMVHLECFRKASFKSLKSDTPLLCPSCHNTVNYMEKECVLYPSEKYEIANYHLGKFMEKGGLNLTTCPCGSQMEVAPGMPDYTSKDDKGQIMSREASEDMAAHRIRCHDCEDNFCSSCKMQPYHTGKTCEQIKKEKESKLCRFCHDIIKGEEDDQVCSSLECKKLLLKTCDKVHECGHSCNGFFDEQECLPCLKPECAKNARVLAKQSGSMEGCLHEGVDEDSYCTVCWVSELGAEPCIKLDCGHVFHMECIKSIIEKKWTSFKITFAFMDCPSCKQEMKLDNCKQLANELYEVNKLKDEIQQLAIARGKHEGIDRDPRLQNANDLFYNNYEAFALFKCSFYSCFKCKKPYFGGMADCENDAMRAADFRKEDCICAKCAADMVGAGVTNCKTHGDKFIDFKCRYCCSVALFFCTGNTHFCNPCHEDAIHKRLKTKDCKGKNCPLGVKHPAGGTEFALGCGLCRSNKFVDI